INLTYFTTNCFQKALLGDILAETAIMAGNLLQCAAPVAWSLVDGRNAVCINTKNFVSLPNQ
ncbi:hypothetical protein, partial [Duncaniella muris]|uniref:hypothetical protein n=1 Tax=Duncaniella muris TaxID=2094150 RepID=UPI0025B7430C